jgi:hypothetical protein
VLLTFKKILAKPWTMLIETVLSGGPPILPAVKKIGLREFFIKCYVLSITEKCKQKFREEKKNFEKDEQIRKVLRKTLEENAKEV